MTNRIVNLPDTNTLAKGSMRYFTRLYHDKPLSLIILLAIIVRLIAAFFSKGWGMHDDHFLVIEPAQAWVDHYNYNNWLPFFNPEAVPSGHSLLYPGFHYLLFRFLEFAGIFDPQIKMLVVRLLHAAFSLLTVYFGFRIVETLSNTKVATKAGLLLALFWFIPFLCVRNLVEVVVIPFLVYGVWLIVNQNPRFRSFIMMLLAGLVMGTGFSIRFQTMAFAGGIGLALLLKKRWADTLYFCLGYLFAIVLVQGIIDYCIWGRPFAEFTEYFTYNLNNATEYIVSAWYTYLLLILGILIPPVSLMIFSGWLMSWRKQLILFLPALLFVLFHSLFPNKQERFILPAVPFIIMSGIIGWEEYQRNSSFWKNHLKWIRVAWIFFWVLNLIVLIPVTTMYSKKARTESMHYLSKYENIQNIMLDNSSGVVKYPPRFYLGQWANVIVIDESYTIPEFKENIHQQGLSGQPQFVLFIRDKNEVKRLKELKEALPGLVYETTIDPGFIDRLLYWLNPVNANQTIVIYRNTNFYK